jgi:hypothetical protein
MDWADVNGCPDCLAGGDATRNAYGLFAKDVEDRFRRHEFESAMPHACNTIVLTVLEALTNISDLGKGIRFIKIQVLTKAVPNQQRNTTSRTLGLE